MGLDPIMRNVDRKKCFTTNTRVEIVLITNYIIRIRSLNSAEERNNASLPRFNFKVKLPYGKSFTIRHQAISTPSSLLHAAMTINQSQGQQFNRDLLG